MKNRTERVITGSITGITQNIVSIVSQLTITPFIILYAGNESLGAYAIILQIIGYALLFDFGFSVSLTRSLCQLYDNKNDSEKFIDLFTLGRNILVFINILFFCFSIIISYNITFFIESDFNIRESQIALCLMSSWMVLRVPIYVYITGLTATQNMATLNIINILENIIKLLAALYFVYHGFGLIGLIFSIILSEFAGGLVKRKYFIKYCKKLKPKWKLIEISKAKDLFTFGFKYWGVNLSTLLLIGSDNLIVGSLFGAVKTSIYYSTKMVGSLFLSFITKLLDQVYPGFNQLIAEGNIYNLKKTYLNLFRYVLLIAIPSSILILFFTKPLVSLWLGAEQFAGKTMTTGIAIFIIIQVFCHLNGIISLAIGEFGNWSLISILSGLFGIFLSFFFGTYMGFEWIIFGSVVAHIPIFLFLFNNICSKLDIKFVDFSIILFKMFIFTIIILLYITLLLNFINITSILTMLFVFFSYLIFWFISSWIIILEKFEKKLIFKFFNYNR